MKAGKQPQVFAQLFCNFLSLNIWIDMKRGWVMIFFFIVACEYNDIGDKDDACMGEPKGIAACPEVLDPVCGCNGVTYGNSCLAESAGVKSWTKGACD